MITPGKMKEEDKVYMYTLRTADGALVENRGVFEGHIFYKETGGWLTSFKYVPPGKIDLTEGILVRGRAVWFREPNPEKARELFFRHKQETKKRYWKMCMSIETKMDKTHISEVAV